jgi:hypothetical protein
LDIMCLTRVNIAAYRGEKVTGSLQRCLLTRFASFSKVELRFLALKCLVRID